SGIQLDQQIAFMNQLIVLDMEGNDLGRRPGTDLGDMAVHIGVIGGNKLADDQPDNNPGDQQDDQNNGNDGNKAASFIEGRFMGLLILVFFLRVVFSFA